MKRENGRSWDRYEVMPLAPRDRNGERIPRRWFGNEPAVNKYIADGRWHGRPPIVIADVSGAVPADAIPKIENVVKNYAATAKYYKRWPGPNSNTFVAAALRAAPELKVSLPPTAIGRDFKGRIYVGLTDTRTGVEANLYGVLGVKIGWVEGVEVNILGLVAGLDIRRLAIEIPAFDRVELTKPFSQTARLAEPSSAAESCQLTVQPSKRDTPL
jgi:hypothetical protein